MKKIFAALLVFCLVASPLLAADPMSSETTVTASGNATEWIKINHSRLNEDDPKQGRLFFTIEGNGTSTISLEHTMDGTNVVEVDTYTGETTSNVGPDYRRKSRFRLKCTAYTDGTKTLHIGHE